MKKMIKKILIIAIVVTFGFPIINCRAGSNELIAINSNNFPCVSLREDIAKNYDENKDGYLSKQERDSVKLIGIDNVLLEENDRDDNTEMYNKLNAEEKYQKYCVFDCKGLEYFPNIKEIYVGAGREIRNLKVLKKLPNLEKLTLMYADNYINYDLSKLKRLKELSLKELKLKNLSICNNSKIKKVDLYMISAKSIKIRDNENLEKIDSEFLAMGNFSCYKNKKLKSLKLYGDFTSKKMIKKNSIQKISISSNINIKKIVIKYFPKLSNLELKNNKTLKSINLRNIPKLKKINLKKCKSKKKIKVDTDRKKIRIIR